MENIVLDSEIEKAGQLIKSVREEIAGVIIGQDDLIEGLLTGIISGGHVLVEGVPGLAKTLSVSTLAHVMDIQFKRIQFTPDLLPADLTGTMIYRPQTGEFIPRKGPVFSHVILADEINRAPAKVQSALLEAMAEKQVTIGDTTYQLPDPFFVLATQNPIEQEGTYQLPEAQLDRFVMKLLIDYPTPEEELKILQELGISHKPEVKAVLRSQDIASLKSISEKIRVDETIQKYIVSIVVASREKDRKHLPFVRLIEYGASPRATLALLNCSRIKAMFEGRSFVLPEDVKAVAYNVLRHRIVLSYEAEAEELSSDNVIQDILSAVSVP